MLTELIAYKIGSDAGRRRPQQPDPDLRAIIVVALLLLVIFSG